MSTKSLCAALALIGMVSASQVMAAPAAKEKSAPAKEKATTAVATPWKIDSAHSVADFSIRHLMISNVKGHFSNITGTIDYDGKDLKSVKIDSEIDVNTVDTGDDGRDKHLKAPDFFDAAKYPKMSFKSKKVKASGKGKFVVTGDLTIKGITKEVNLDVEGPSEQIKDPQGNTKVGASATTTIKRKDFGITFNKAMDNGGSVISDDVKVSIEVEATKEK